MPIWVFAAGFVVLAAPKADTAADRVMLRDGSIVLGQVVEPSPRGTIQFVVRRAWIETHLPELARRWEAAERKGGQRADAQRRDRLEAWKRDRTAHAEPGNPILPWVERELARLAAEDPAGSTLMMATLPVGQVQRVIKAPGRAGRWLRLGWLSGFKNVEELPLDALRDGLEGRGFDLDSPAHVPLERLLPIPIETEWQWLTRRAATEAMYDTGLRFIRFEQLIVPEPVPGQPPDAKAMLSALPDVVKLLAGEAEDGLPERLREVGARGRVGAVVTRQETGPGLESVTIEMVLWVRGSGNRWAPFGSRTVTVKPGDLKEDEGKEIADDPQVQAAFRLIESLGFGRIPADVRQRSLNVGAATRKALAQARSAFQDDLSKLALAVEDQARPAVKRNAAP
jgi:hypothetical protein